MQLDESIRIPGPHAHKRCLSAKRTASAWLSGVLGALLVGFAPALVAAAEPASGEPEAPAEMGPDVEPEATAVEPEATAVEPEIATDGAALPAAVEPRPAPQPIASATPPTVTEAAHAAAPAPPSTAVAPPSGAASHRAGDLVITPGGYLEFFYAHNFNRPQNKLTALRGFDFVNGSLMVGNFVMSLDAAFKGFSARLAINVGASPSQFYAQEPTTSSSHHIPALDRNTWSLIQEAIIGWSPKRTRGLTIQAGVMATPIGIEGLANHQSWRGSMASPHMHPKDYRENWNWSRSNSFINVPDYHSGVRLLYSATPKHHFGAFLVNGQNMVTDNNDGKSYAGTYLWMPSPRFHMSVVYMTGPERARDAPEGQGWRHLFDYSLRWEATKNLHFMAQAVPGVEDTAFGTNLFLINVAYASWRFRNDARLAFRYEHLFERVAPGSSPVFVRSLGADNTAALYGYTGTFSLPLVPDHLMVRLEYRHDRSPLRWFYRGKLEESGNSYAPYVPNARSQNTMTVGVVGWF